MHFKHLSHSHSFTQFIWQNNNVSLLHLFICPFGNSRHITDCFVTIDLKCKYKIDSDCSAESAVWKNFHWNYLKIMQTLAKNVFIEKKEAKKEQVFDWDVGSVTSIEFRHSINSFERIDWRVFCDSVFIIFSRANLWYFCIGLWVLQLSTRIKCKNQR